jgi:hypothetical protein
VTTATEAQAARLAQPGPRKWIKGPRCAQDFADVVARYLDRIAEDTITIGTLLIEAKTKVAPGEWGRMFRDHEHAVARPIPFGIRTGQMLMKIAEHPVLSDTNHGSHLPTSWRTLYELTKLPEPLLEKALAEGHVHPGMERRHVLALRVDLTPRTSKVVVGAPLAHEYDPGPNTDMDLNDFDRDLSAAFPDLDRDEQVRVVARLRLIADALEGQIREIEVEPVVEVVAPAAEYRCTSCDRDLTEDELVTVRECSQPDCEGNYWNGTDEGNNCPGCNRPFSRVITYQGCPDCLEEDSVRHHTEAQVRA